MYLHQLNSEYEYNTVNVDVLVVKINFVVLVSHENKNK